MTEQMEFFPQPNRKRTRRVWNTKAPVSENMSKILTCWKHCSYCDPRLLEQRNKNPKRRIYRLCTRPDRTIEERCFESSVICQGHRPHPETKSAMSSGKGWEDY